MIDFEERTASDAYGLDISSLIQNIVSFFSDADPQNFLSTLSNWWEIWSIVAFILSAIFLFGFIYSKIRFDQLSEIETELFRQEDIAFQNKNVSKEGGGRLADIRNNIDSENPNDWKQAIIEADVLLSSVLVEAGYIGDTLGEQLKSANSNTFQTIQDAWSAHKIRNQIAHGGSDFILTKKIAVETINQYQRVFTEFKVI